MNIGTKLALGRAARYAIMPAIALLFATSITKAGSLPPLTTWYWQLDGTVNTTRTAKVYDIDMEENTPATINQLKTAGHTVICYISAGTWEDWRSDAAAFPDSIKGNSVSGWPGERWLDIRSPIVQGLMNKRMDVAKSKNCDGIEPDSVDVASNHPGFPITQAQNITYLQFISAAAHQRGMIVGLKNSTEMVSALVTYFDFAIVEECFKYKECPAYSPFVKAGKAVFAAEYNAFSTPECNTAKGLGFSLAFFALNLNGHKYEACP
jgi:hypothetical protein